MAIVKKPLKSKPVCKVTFKIPNTEVKEAGQISLIGEFNEWNPTVHQMKKLKDGSFSITLDLEKDKKYQFRYLLDGKYYLNDDESDDFVLNPFGSENSLINL
ncbi:MAG: isoamylase early set domain-containing protein [Melioribacteraceae bacterium]|nr:isoamylase early set domain-containing protein [Melioribacteraceae bacterium]MCF8354478.1 isoamylase early set domain-containing protein [Melioribacteraceae bacterium]MCF8394088.1 isoamylase early set domain-containing protein [Melioribacteraceae bacterium]MCF8419859.1 isoamylase early set domain-containing protein [Melioribacteraceae bacterium]